MFFFALLNSRIRAPAYKHQQVTRPQFLRKVFSTGQKRNATLMKNI